MTRRELREHCFKMLFSADFYPTREEAKAQLGQYLESPEEDGEDSQETEEDSRSETDLKRSAELSRELDEDYFQWKEQQEGSGEEPDHRGRGKGFSLFGKKW